MIILNGVKFAESNDELLDSLFESAITCGGTAKRLKRRIKLFNHQGGLIGIINKQGLIYKATQVDNDYYYSLDEIRELGLYDDMMNEFIEPASYAVGEDKNGLIFN